MSPDLVLISTDAGTNPSTSQCSLADSLSPTESSTNTDNGTLQHPLPTEEWVAEGAPRTQGDWLDPRLATEAIRIKKHTDISHDLRYRPQGHTASDDDAEGTTAPRRIPTWVLP